MNVIKFGDCRDIMRRWADEGLRAQMCVTSPPYWGLRDYGVDGQIGLESDYREYLRAIVEVFRCVRDVLADDGVLWVNMGDSYAGSAGSAPPSSSSTLMGNGHVGGGPKVRGIRASFRRDDAPTPRSDVRVPGLKPKDLVGMPWRVAFALQEDGWYLRQDVIWAKPNPMPESVRDRCTKAHEYVFLLAKRERYYWDAEAMQEPVTGGAHPRLPGNKAHKGAEAYEAGDKRHRTKAGIVAHAERARAAKIPAGWANGTGRSHDEIQGRYSHARKLADPGSGTRNNRSMDAALAVMPSTRNMRSVWTIPTQGFPDAHFATFPEALVERCILAGSRPGDVVLDPFMGSGTTAQVAQRLGRQWLGCELNRDYAPMQRRRLAETVGMPL